MGYSVERGRTRESGSGRGFSVRVLGGRTGERLSREVGDVDAPHPSPGLITQETRRVEGPGGIPWVYFRQTDEACSFSPKLKLSTNEK